MSALDDYDTIKDPSGIYDIVSEYVKKLTGFDVIEIWVLEI